MTVAEPRIWSDVTDVLPDYHPLLPYLPLYCQACKTMVHASNNESMDTWVETGRGPHCLPCFAAAARDECLADPDGTGRPWALVDGVVNAGRTPYSEEERVLEVKAP